MVQFESWIDRQIREAMERGEFDNLPGQGKPLDLDADEDWWIKAKIRRENLEPVLPTALSLRKEVATIQDRLADVTKPETARAICADLNARIRQFYASAESRPAFVVRLLDIESELRIWQQRS